MACAESVPVFLGEIALTQQCGRQLLVGELFASGRTRCPTVVPAATHFRPEAASTTYNYSILEVVRTPSENAKGAALLHSCFCYKKGIGMPSCLTIARQVTPL